MHNITLINSRQIPRILGPGLNKAGKFPSVVTHNDNLGVKVDEIKATVKFQMKKVIIEFLLSILKLIYKGSLSGCRHWTCGNEPRGAGGKHFARHQLPSLIAEEELAKCTLIAH
jgi:hypothetical protein